MSWQLQTMKLAKKKEILMKSNFVFTVGLIFILGHAALAQDMKRVPEPEYLGVFLFLDSTTAVVVDL